MRYRDAEIETRGPFVLPTTKAGRKLINRALRGGWSESAGVYDCALPVFIHYRNWYGSFVFERKKDAYTDTAPAFWSGWMKLPYSRVDVCAAWDNHCREYEAERASVEQEEIIDAIKNRAWRFSKADKANAETLKSAIQRERERQKRRIEERIERSEAAERLARSRRAEVYDALGSAPSRRTRRSKREQLLALGIIA